MIACVYDDDLRRQRNAQRMNYWDAYIGEISDLLGLRLVKLSATDLERDGALDGVETLIAGRLSGAALSDAARKAIAEWVCAGGTLIGFAVDGLDEVFGIEPAVTAQPTVGNYTPRNRLEQGSDDWAINGYFELRSHRLTREVHNTLFVQQRLPIISDIALVRLAGAVELAVLFDAAGRLLCMPAITWNEHGRGRVGYFAFDVAQTVWLLHQGRPAPDHPEGSKFPRAQEMSVLGDNSRMVPYADELCLLVQNMIAVKPQPFIHPVPPKDGAVADALLYYGGDEYKGPTEVSIRAAEFMHEMGLPYQTNIESDNHPMTAAEHRRIRELGTEVSAYYHLYAEDGFAMRPEHYKFQSDRFLERFGYRPVATVNHCLRWKGWTEPAKWMLAAGTRADNGFSGKTSPNDSHFRNSAGFAFGFGTCYPFYFWDDWRGGNERIDFMEQPIVCYELGHRNSTSINRDPDTGPLEEAHFIVGLAIRCHWVMNMFYHPHYLVNCPRCREAVAEMLRYIDYRGATVVHMNNRMVAEWWDARHASKIEAVSMDASGVTVRCDCAYAGGMVIKIGVPDGCRAEMVDADRPHKVLTEFGRDWLYIAVPAGASTVTVRFAAQG